MKRKTFETKRGSTVRIEIQHVRSSSSSSGSKGPETGKSVFSSEDEDEVFAFRKKGKAVSLYDLGTRLRSVATADLVEPLGLRFRSFPVHDSQTPADDNSDEYVDIALEVAGTHIGPPNVGPPENEKHHFLVSDAEWKLFDDMLLGSLKPVPEGETKADDTDPTEFSTACGSSRKMPHCQEVDNSIAHNNIIPASLTNFLWIQVGVGAKHFYSSGDPDQFIDFEVKDPPVGSEAERWNRLNNPFNQLRAKDKDLFKTESGSVRIGGNYFLDTGTVWQVVDGRVFIAGDVDKYLGFETDPASPYCKVTSEPSFSSAPAVYTFGGKDNRFYMRPRVFGISIDDSAFNRLFNWVGKAPTYAGFNCALRRSPFGGGLAMTGDYSVSWNLCLNPIFISGIGEALNGVEVPAGGLVAIIAQGAKRFYVWAKQDWISFFPPQYAPLSDFGDCTTL